MDLWIEQYFYHPKFQEKNLKRIINILLENCFSLQFIFTTINTRIKTLANKIITETKNTNGEAQSRDNFFTIPYVKSISESFLPITKNTV